MQVLTFFLTIGFVSIHIFAKNLHILNVITRHHFLSLSSGIAVSYVFVHLLPELNHYQKVLETSIKNDLLSVIESHIYIMSLVGLVLFYSLEVVVKKEKENNKETKKSSLRIFQIHIGSFFLYNAIIGYLLVRGDYDGMKEVVMFFLAMSVHFIANDWSLRTSHQEVYHRYGRWLIAFAILFGWGVGVLFEVKEVIVSLLVAFLAGGIILNVMKEELPDNKNSSIPAFLVGITGYTVLLLLM